MDSPRPVADGIWMLRSILVNVFFVKVDDGWMLVDAGLARSAPAILRAAVELFGSSPPRAIVLTHGHFDHVGALPRLLEAWDVPVYAHPFELPHLTGRQPYAPPDPTVGGGLVAWSSFLFPRGPYNFGSRLLALPPDGRVPVAPDWVAIHTPGHTAGHISLFRGADGVVIAGDAVTTTQQESLIAVATQRAGAARTAGLLHDRLGRGALVGPAARRDPRRDAAVRPWPADGRRIDATRSARSRGALRRARAAAARPLRRVRRGRSRVPAPVAPAAGHRPPGGGGQRPPRPLPQRGEPYAYASSRAR